MTEKNVKNQKKAENDMYFPFRALIQDHYEQR